MFISVAENLPKTSYIKMVDLWLLVSLAIPFFEVTQTIQLEMKIFCVDTFAHCN